MPFAAEELADRRQVIDGDKVDMILAIWLAERRKISDLARGDLAREAGTPQVLERS